jgi:hypothetical protein
MKIWRVGWLLITMVMIMVMGLSPSAANAQALAFEAETSVTYQFGEQIEFQFSVDSMENIDAIWLFVQPVGMGIANFSVPLEETGLHVIAIKPEQLLLRPYSDVDYWYQIEFADEPSIKTDTNRFRYLDNRYDWRRIQSNQFELYWLSGNEDFGLAALNTAQQAWLQLAERFSEEPNTPVMIYLYPDADALQSALDLTDLDWVAGHVDPHINAILLSIAPSPDQRLEMQRQIPHELAHLFVYAQTGPGYSYQPVWLMEGLASGAELADNEGYSAALSLAADRKEFILMADLCQSFPQQTEQVYLAYAQSASFAEYLQNEFGHAQLHALMGKYAEGVSCESGFLQTYGMSLSKAQTQWQKDTFRATLLSAFAVNMGPYVILLTILMGLPWLAGRLQRPKQEDGSHGG